MTQIILAFNADEASIENGLMQKSMNTGSLDI